MRVREQNAALGKSIDIWCHCLWVSTEDTHPVVEIVDGDKEDVWPIVFLRMDCDDRNEKDPYCYAQPSHPNAPHGRPKALDSTRIGGA